MLAIEGLSVELGGRRVLHGISTRVDEGGWLALVGPNGAGKTTLVRAIAGLVDFDGSVRLGGRAHAELDRREAARLVAYVPQRPVMPPSMPVVDYVLLGRAPHHSYLGAETAADRDVVASVLDRLELEGFARRPLGSLSGGEAQRVVLGRALAQQAPVLAMDEPTASLDLGHAQLVLELTDALRRERALAVVMALHDLTLAGQYADRLLLLEEGRCVAEGDAGAVLTPETIARHFGAAVEVRDGPDGPVVSPVRRRRGTTPRATAGAGAAVDRSFTPGRDGVASDERRGGATC